MTVWNGCSTARRPRSCERSERRPPDDRRRLLLACRIVGGIDVDRSRRSGAGDLNRDPLASCHREMVGVRGFRIEAARWQGLQGGLVELRPVTEIPGSGDDGGNTIVGM